MVISYVINEINTSEVTGICGALVMAASAAAAAAASAMAVSAAVELSY